MLASFSRCVIALVRNPWLYAWLRLAHSARLRRWSHLRLVRLALRSLAPCVSVALVFRPRFVRFGALGLVSNSLPRVHSHFEDAL